jgi:hypothetical protein
MAEENKNPLSSEKTASLKTDLMALNVKNAQAMKLLDAKYAVKNQVGRKQRSQAGTSRMDGLAQLGSATSINLPQGYVGPRNG